MVWRHIAGRRDRAGLPGERPALQRSPGPQQGQEDAVPAVDEHRHLGDAVSCTAISRQGRFEVVLPREKGHKYSVEHRDGLFYFRTNRDAKNFRLVTAPVSSPSPPNWKELLPHRAGRALGRRRAVSRLPGGRPKNRRPSTISACSIFGRASGTKSASRRASTPPLPHPRRNTRRGSFRFSYQSMITPLSVYDYDMATRQQTLKKRQEVPGYDPGPLCDRTRSGPSRTTASRFRCRSSTGRA